MKVAAKKENLHRKNELKRLEKLEKMKKDRERERERVRVK